MNVPFSWIIYIRIARNMSLRLTNVLLRLKAGVLQKSFFYERFCENYRQIKYLWWNSFYFTGNSNAVISMWLAVSGFWNEKYLFFGNFHKPLYKPFDLISHSVNLLISINWYGQLRDLPHLVFTSSKSTTETPGQCGKSVQR